MILAGLPIEREGRVLDHLLFHPDQAGYPGDLTRPIVGDASHEHSDVHLDVIESTGGKRDFGHDRDLLGDHFAGHRSDRVGTYDTGVHRAVDADDVGLTGGDRQHPLATTSDDDRRARGLHGLGQPGVVGDRVVLTLERERLGCHSALDDSEAFDEAVDADAGAVIGNAGLFVVARSSTPRRGRSRPDRRTARPWSPVPWPVPAGVCSRCRRPRRWPVTSWWHRAPLVSAGTGASWSPKWSGMVAMS